MTPTPRRSPNRRRPPSTSTVTGRGRTAPKGRPTPKRTAGRKPPPLPPPTTRKEAYRRQRELAKSRRSAARSGLAAGDERFVGRRDQGPVRALARDIVDSRRSPLTLFLPSALVLFIGGSLAPSAAVRTFSSTFWLALVVLMVVDGFLLTRTVRRVVDDRHPDNTEKSRSLAFYAIARSTQFRRLRLPKPRLRAGDAY